MRVYRDSEIKWFYGIIISLTAIPLLLTAIQREWGACATVVVIVFGFLYFGWPLSARIDKDGSILFKGIIRRVRVTPESLVHVKGVGVHDYRAHIAFRVKGDIPLGYRCRKYQNRAVLAQAMLDVIEKSRSARVTDDALKLLRQVAKGSTKPLPMNKRDNGNVL